MTNSSELKGLCSTFTSMYKRNTRVVIAISDRYSTKPNPQHAKLKWSSDWLTRKHHPIREEQTAWQLQAVTQKIISAYLELKCRTVQHYSFHGLALRVLYGIQAKITMLKHRMDNEDPKNEDQRSKAHPARTPNAIKWYWLNQISTTKYLFIWTTLLEF